MKSWKWLVVALAVAAAAWAQGPWWQSEATAAQQAQVRAGQIELNRLTATQADPAAVAAQAQEVQQLRTKLWASRDAERPVTCPRRNTLSSAGQAAPGVVAPGRGGGAGGRGGGWGRGRGGGWGRGGGQGRGAGRGWCNGTGCCGQNPDCPWRTD